MDERGTTTQALDTVRRAERFWARAGVPRGQRRRQAEELHDHLLSAIADGREVSEVTGDDVATFAAEWAAADRGRTGLQVALALVALGSVSTGLFVLAGPALFGHDRTGIDGATVAAIVPTLFVSVMTFLVHQYRHRLTRDRTVWIGLATFAAWLAMIPAGSALREAEAFLAIPSVLAGALLAVGVLAAAQYSLSKRSPRR